MDYLEFKITCSEEFKDILSAELSEIGFDSFMESDSGLDAYTEKGSFDREAFEEVISRYQKSTAIVVVEGVLSKINWNEEWEKNYDPIEVDELVYVRASFHPSAKGFRHEIIINPKMSFGTGHHATTFLMLRHQGVLAHQGKRVLDVGSGTGILAIMAHLLGAKEIEAFDIDEWCVENGNENFELNQLKTKMQLGTIREVQPEGSFDIILANINKNILLDEMSLYVDLIPSGGHLLLSGFYKSDMDDLLKKAEPLGMSLVKFQTKDDWAALILLKS